MLKINLQLFGEESTGVDENVAARHDIATEEVTQELDQHNQDNSGVNQEPDAGANESVEKAFAARLQKNVKGWKPVSDVVFHKRELYRPKQRNNNNYISRIPN